MVIFNSYVKLPEGKSLIRGLSHHRNMMKHEPPTVHGMIFLGYLVNKSQKHVNFENPSQLGQNWPIFDDRSSQHGRHLSSVTHCLMKKRAQPVNLEHIYIYTDIHTYIHTCHISTKPRLNEYNLDIHQTLSPIFQILPRSSVPSVMISSVQPGNPNGSPAICWRPTASCAALAATSPAPQCLLLC